MKILCINVRKGIGDQIIFLPFIHAISEKFKSPISLLAKKNSKAEELFSEDSSIDEVINLNENMDGIKGILKLSKEIKNRNFDKIFIFNSSLRYNIVARLAGVKSIYQYPLFRKKDNIVLSAKIFTEDIINKVVSTEPNLVVKNSEKLDERFKHICLGVSASGPTKRWDIQNYIRLAESINKKIKCKFYIAGGKNDIALINEFKSSKIKNNFISFENLSIKKTLPIIKNMNLMISNDTSWSHIAVSLKVKTLTLFMDSPIMAYGRYSSRMTTIEPIGEKDTTTHDTLGKDKISFDEVYKKSIEMLN
ncbi:glycosyltransferase family 9 protein [Candidatus Pelagibacter bacterium]|nr:glycosyltransferase family 9 protein [Candidatus Pelagibacter bacterium]